MNIPALSVVSPWGTRIAEGKKTVEVRRWAPPILPVPQLLIVENGRRLDAEGDTDPDGRAVAIVRVETVRPWRPEDAAAACSVWEDGWLAWELRDVRPISRPFRMLAARRIYEVQIDEALTLEKSALRREALVATEIDLPWLPMPNRIDLILSSEPPPSALTTSAFVLAFDGERFAMTDLRQRGWDLPGGHVETAETPEVAARRELEEECGLRVGPLRPIGYQRVRLLGPAPAGYRYPHPDSFMAFFAGIVSEAGACTAGPETRGRGFFLPTDPAAQAWVRKNRALYDAALDALRADQVKSPDFGAPSGG